MESLIHLALVLLDPTEAYEYFVVTAIPAGIALLFTPILNDNVPQVVAVGEPVLASTKSTIACAMLVAQVLNLATWYSTDVLKSLPSMLAAVLSFLASAIIVSFFHSSRKYAFPSANFQNLFLTSTLVYDLAIVRQSEKIQGSIGVFPFAVAVLKFLYVCINSAYRNPVILVRVQPTEETLSDGPSLPSIWSCLSWPRLISVPGFEENPELVDLPEPVWNLCSETIFLQFREHWDRVDKTSSKALIKAVTSTLGGMFLSIIPLRLLHVLLTLAQPLLLWHILTTAFHDGGSPGIAAVNIITAAAIWIGIPVLKLAFTQQSDCIVVSTRAILIAAIYDKMMRISAANIQKSTALSQLMDGMRSIELLIDSTQDVVSATIQAWLGLCLMWPFLGNASLLIFAPTALAALASFFSGKQEIYFRSLVKDRRNARVALTSSILGQLRSIKMMGLGPALAMYLKEQRASEVCALLKERGSRMREFSILAFNHSMTPVLVIAGYLYLGNPAHSLGVAETFTCFMLIRIVSNAFNTAVDRLSSGQQGNQILTRIQEFLLLDEIVDQRLIAELPENGGDVADSSGTRAVVEFARVTVVSETGQVILLDATFRAFRYGVTMVFGPVASGKSTVLRLILGELAPNSGRITVISNSMVYCDQEVWLPCICIQHIIVGSAMFDAEWYAILIRACRLDEDLAQLPEGDMTVVGGPGCRLSVNLKQKISLARAVYDQPTIIVLDDPLNSLHFNTASQIYSNLFGPRGIVFDWECTVIMATNIFGHLAYAHAIYTIGYDGRLVNQDPASYLSPANTRAVLQDSNGLFDCTSYDEGALQSTPALQMELPSGEEQTQRHSQDTSLYAYFQQPAGKLLVWSWPMAVTVAAIVEKSPEIFWGWSLSGDMLSSACVAGYSAFGVANIIFNRMAAHLYFNYISAETSNALHWKLIKTVMTATPEFVSNANTLSMLKLFDDDLETISRGLPITFMQCSFMVISIAVDAAIISFCAKYSLIFVVALWALLRRVHRVYLPFSHRLRFLETRTLAGVTARCTETAAGVEHIRAFRQQSAFYQDFYEALTVSQKPYYYVFEAKRQMEYTAAFFTAAVGLVIISLAHAYPQSSSPAKLGLALVSIIDLTETLKFISTIWARLDEYLGAVFRIRKFCHETPVEVDEDNTSLPSQWPSAGAAEFYRVVPEHAATEGPNNVSVVDAYLEGPQKIVISARAGSGQGSFILAVLRMINYSGAIRIDDMNIKTVPRDILRSRITTITREGLELEGTLRINLDPFSMLEHYFSDADLISMLHRVKLWDTVQRRGGLDVSLKRMRFSKAQKQLLSLGRGALHRRRENTKVVLIDDAITHLDNNTADKIQDFINGEFASCTVFMVAYDLEAFRTADTIITVEGGAITRVLERNSESEDDD